jgi:hypothetical protein
MLHQMGDTAAGSCSSVFLSMKYPMLEHVLVNYKILNVVDAGSPNQIIQDHLSTAPISVYLGAIPAI